MCLYAFVCVLSVCFIVCGWAWVGVSEKRGCVQFPAVATKLRTLKTRKLVNGQKSQLAQLKLLTINYLNKWPNIKSTKYFISHSRCPGGTTSRDRVRFIDTLNKFLDSNPCQQQTWASLDPTQRATGFNHCQRPFGWIIIFCFLFVVAAAFSVTMEKNQQNRRSQCYWLSLFLFWSIPVM